ncbi:uncharacterized protein LOC135473997 [Liolophura sinensis]|uniref:uncharacterized protein LOC135473997 n=1 Tax=Liolophura sinensis TaxID=3198878 RepID=UPI003158DE23
MVALTAMTTKQKIFVAVNCFVASLLVTGLYFRLLTPAPPLCNRGSYSFIAYISHVLLGYHRDRWIIYVCDYGQSCGELPLRLDGIISTYILSVLSTRKFGIIFTKPAPLHQLLKPVKFNWIVNPSALGFASCNYYNYMFNDEFGSKLKTMDLDLEFQEEVVYIKLHKYYWNSLYQNPRYAGKLRGNTASGTYYQTFLNLFEPQPKFKHTVLKYSNHFKSNLSTNLVCVIASETDQKHNQGYTIWKFLDKVSHSKNTRILLSTADQDLVRQTRQRFPSNVFTVSGSQRYIDGDDTSTSAGETLSDNLVTNLLDFYALIQCDELAMTCGSVWGRLVAFCRNTNQGLRYLQNDMVRNVDLDALSMDYEEGACSSSTINNQNAQVISA